MKQIKPGQEARTTALLLPLTLVIVTVLALTISGVVVAKKCDSPPCGGSGGGGDTSAEYTAALVSGAFTFDAVDVSLNRKGNTYSSTDELYMIRPDDSDDSSQLQWDDVFTVCPELFSGDEVFSVLAPDNWTIDNSGGKNAGKVGSNIRVSFRDVSVPDFPGAVLDFGLIGVLEEELPPTGGTISVTLTKFNFFGAGDPPAGCSSGTLDLYTYSVLEITRI